MCSLASAFSSASRFASVSKALLISDLKPDPQSRYLNFAFDESSAVRSLFALQRRCFQSLAKFDILIFFSPGDKAMKGVRLFAAVLLPSASSTFTF
jgi:hypothetical protein